MRLDKLLAGIYNEKIEEKFIEKNISSINSDSRKVEKNSLFIAIKGEKYDGNNFIAQAITKGACVIVSEDDANKDINIEDVCFLKVDNANIFLRKLVEKFYQNPSEHLKIIGITGTNGKTTITYLIESILHQAEQSCSVIGTINYRMGEKILPAQKTTPDFVDIHRILSNIVRDGVDYCIMEVSSHALVQGRVDNIIFKTAVFTNLTSDHLDYHKTRENYFSAKAKLFIGLNPNALSIINSDDVYGKKLFSKTESRILTCGIKKNADVMAKNIESDISGTQFKLVCPEGEVIIRTKLVGEYNVYNILAAAAVCISEGINLDKIKLGIENLKLVPGRLEKIDFGQNYSIFIDYAHTADALEHVLTMLKRTSGAKIILVFGCGGDRDKTKRPEMGKVAGMLADISIVTTDNPRSEDPKSIIDQIVKGFENDNYLIIEDREQAIKKALSMAQEGDVVLIAGKGHETYQIFDDVTINFNEKNVVRDFLL